MVIGWILSHPFSFMWALLLSDALLFCLCDVVSVVLLLVVNSEFFSFGEYWCLLKGASRGLVYSVGCDGRGVCMLAMSPCSGTWVGQTTLQGSAEANQTLSAPESHETQQAAILSGSTCKSRGEKQLQYNLFKSTDHGTDLKWSV